MSGLCTTRREHFTGMRRGGILIPRRTHKSDLASLTRMFGDGRVKVGWEGVSLYEPANRAQSSL